MASDGYINLFPNLSAEILKWAGNIKITNKCNYSSPLLNLAFNVFLYLGFDLINRKMSARLICGYQQLFPKNVCEARS